MSSFIQFHSLSTEWVSEWGQTHHQWADIWAYTHMAHSVTLFQLLYYDFSEPEYINWRCALKKCVVSISRAIKKLRNLSHMYVYPPLNPCVNETKNSVNVRFSRWLLHCQHLLVSTSFLKVHPYLVYEVNNLLQPCCTLRDRQMVWYSQIADFLFLPSLCLFGYLYSP